MDELTRLQGHWQILTLKVIEVTSCPGGVS
jgi:hypothetical protein